MKIGLIGAGRIGKLHGEILTHRVPEVEIKSVAEIYADTVEKWVQRQNITNLTADYKNILNDPEIEAVLICSSTDTHSQLIIESAAAGKHIFCEKPIDIEVKNDFPNSATLSTADGVASEKPQFFFLERYQASYVAELKAFVSAVLNDTPPPVTGIDGLQPVLIGAAALRSYKDNRPVMIKEIQSTDAA